VSDGNDLFLFFCFGVHYPLGFYTEIIIADMQNYEYLLYHDLLLVSINLTAQM
jgi:hypothetical protein